MKGTIPNFKRLIATYINRFNDADRKLVEKFVLEARVFDVSNPSMFWYLVKIKNIRFKYLKKGFTGCDKQDIKELVARINQVDYSERTKDGYRFAIRKFFQVIEGYEWTSKKFPQKVDWIKIKPPRRKKKYEILDKNDIEKMIASAKTLRNKTIVAILWEGGFRLGEFANIKISDISWDEYGCVIRVFGKTGFGSVRIVEYSGYLEMYLRKRKHDSEWVWTTEDNFSRGRKMSRKSIRAVLVKAGKMAGITKPLNPQNFRTSSATYCSKFLTDAEMRIRFRWRWDSKMPSHYSWLSARDVDQKYISMFYPRKEVKIMNRTLKDFIV